MNDTGVPSPIGPSPEQERLLREIAPPVPEQHPLAEQLNEVIQQFTSNPALTVQLDRLLLLVNTDHQKIHTLETKQEAMELELHQLRTLLQDKGKPDDGVYADDGS